MPVTRLGRFTTRYVLAEDRICLMGRSRDDDAATHCIWLTARLLRQLVPELLKGLAPEQGVHPLRRAAEQRFAQQAARAAQPPLPAVEAPSSSEAPAIEWVGTVVRLRRTPKTVELILARDAGEEAQAVLLTLTPALQRQWLNVLHDQWRRADWPPDIWPTWMREGAAPLQRGPSAAVH